MIPNFLSRSKFLLDEEIYKKISETNVTIIGLGGVGGLVFLSLVRLGFTKFKVVENGIFDEPDMNRQALAFNSTIGKNKIIEYVKSGLDINPKLQIQTFQDGLTINNIDSIFKNTDVIVRVMDYEKDESVKNLCNLLLSDYGKPLFQASCVGLVSMVHNFHHNGMKPNKFWELLISKHVFKNIIETTPMVDRLKDHKSPSTCIGANTASLLLTTEILLYVLKDFNIADRQTVFVPQFIFYNPLTLNLSVMDITKL